MAGEAERRLKEQDINVPDAGAPAGNYVPWVRSGNLLFVSGQLPFQDGALTATGTCGADVDVATAAEAAKVCAINILAQVKAAVGDLDNVRQVVKLTGFVSATAAFKDHPKVVNGASDLFVEAFGERGRHARAAVGMASLPLGAVVEVEAILDVG